MPSKRDRRRAILSDKPQGKSVPVDLKIIRFGSPRCAADRCTLIDAPAQFALCLDCSYNQGAHDDGIRCGHRFAIDPTLVEGRLTQVRGGDISFLEEDTGSDM